MRQFDKFAQQRIAYLEAENAKLMARNLQLEGMVAERDELVAAVKAEIAKMKQDREYESI